jgi:hypothetical protein
MPGQEFKIFENIFGGLGANSAIENKRFTSDWYCRFCRAKVSSINELPQNRTEKTRKFTVTLGVKIATFENRPNRLIPPIF